MKSKTMSNKQITAVEWLSVQMLWNEFHNPYLEQAKEMEAQKQQKYDEMLAMLEECFRFTKRVQDPATSALLLRNEIEQLIKEAKEL
jgi:hypothetical protein